MHNEFPSRVPWNWQPSLSEMCKNESVDFDKLIAGLAENKNDGDLAASLNADERTVQYLRNHFEQFGVGSVIGQD